MLKCGGNIYAGVPVTVTRKRVKRITLRVKADGTVWLSLPFRGATLDTATAFLIANWPWVARTRERLLADPPVRPSEPTAEEVAELHLLLAELTADWAARLGEPGVTWKLRKMRSRWGVCHFADRRITYAEMLAGKPRELVEYVVVHELTHLKAHNHGPAFKALMDLRLPGWRLLRRRLNHPGTREPSN